MTTIRAAATPDSAAIARIRLRAFRAAYDGIVPAALLDGDEQEEARAWAEYLSAPPAGDRLWLAERDGTVCGFCRTGPGSDDDWEGGEVHGLYLDPELTGAGIGSALLEHALEALTANRLVPVVVWVFEQNERALRFYARHGFTPDRARRPNSEWGDVAEIRLGQRDRVVGEATLAGSEVGLLPASQGWFILNARETRWFQRPGRSSVPLTGCDEFEAETYFPMLGMSIQVLAPGEANSTYHWETEQEDFLLLAGEALAIIEGQERPLRQWDFVHCPPQTRHVFVGAGETGCVLLAASSRQFQANGPWGVYSFDETAHRHHASPPHDTQDNRIADESVPDSQASRYREGWLPGA